MRDILLSKFFYTEIRQKSYVFGNFYIEIKIHESKTKITIFMIKIDEKLLW